MKTSNKTKESRQEVIWAPNYTGASIERYELCADGLYRWHGEYGYAALTRRELLKRQKAMK